MLMLAMMRRSAAFTILTAIVLGPGMVSAASEDDELRDEAKKLFGVIKGVSDKTLNAPDVTLGRALFWDTRLSGNGKIACASCHQPNDWGADLRRFSLDAKDKDTARNSQTVFNAMLQPSLRWTGDRKSGAHQAEKSLTGSMGFASPDAVVPLLMEFGYEAAFKSAFPKNREAVSPANYAKALQAYQATLITPAPFDRFLSGEDAAMNAKQKNGLRIFISVGCADCHKGSLLGGGSIRQFGVLKEYWTATKSEKKDPGLFDSTNKETDRYKFRVSMLRNIAKTGPYFHDGSVGEIKEAVQVMADVQLGSRLSDTDATAIVSFFDALTGELPNHYSKPEMDATEKK
jgi:cytochrome c peroxidase